MAPNTNKNVTALLQTFSSDDLQHLQASVQAKFLPLSDETSESSTEHTARDDSGVVVVANQQQQRQQSASYWDWPADTEQQQDDVDKSIIDRIVAEEKAYKVVSGANVELIESHAKDLTSEKEMKNVSNVSHSNDKYWAWQEDTQQAASPFQELLEYEAARQMLMVDNIVRQIQSSVKVPSDIGYDTAKNDQQIADDYWSWSEEYYVEPLATSARPVVSVGGSSTHRGYWDW